MAKDTTKLVQGFERSAKEAAYKRKHGHGIGEAVRRLKGAGSAESTAKKVADKEARTLAEMERQEDADRQTALGAGLTIMLRARRGR
jgi:hypothetical protein